MSLESESTSALPSSQHDESGENFDDSTQNPDRSPIPRPPSPTSDKSPTYMVLSETSDHEQDDGNTAIELTTYDETSNLDVVTEQGPNGEAINNENGTEAWSFDKNINDEDVIETGFFKKKFVPVKRRITAETAGTDKAINNENTPAEDSDDAELGIAELRSKLSHLKEQSIALTTEKHAIIKQNELLAEDNKKLQSQNTILLQENQHLKGKVKQLVNDRNILENKLKKQKPQKNGESSEKKRTLLLMDSNARYIKEHLKETGRDLTHAHVQTSKALIEFASRKEEYESYDDIIILVGTNDVRHDPTSPRLEVDAVIAQLKEAIQTIRTNFTGLIYIVELPPMEFPFGDFNINAREVNGYISKIHFADAGYIPVFTSDLYDNCYSAILDVDNFHLTRDGAKITSNAIEAALKSNQDNKISYEYIKRDFLKYFIGSNGININKLRRKYNVEIATAQTTDREGEAKISIKGKAGSVKSMEEEISRIRDQHKPAQNSRRERQRQFNKKKKLRNPGENESATSAAGQKRKYPESTTTIASDEYRGTASNEYRGTASDEYRGSYPKSSRGGFDAERSYSESITAAIDEFRGSYPRSGHRHTEATSYSGFGDIAEDIFGTSDYTRSSSYTPKTSAKPCRFYKQGKCRNGRDCPFSHGDDDFDDDI